MRATKKYIVGIDEVGRGPLAGPMLIGAFAMPFGLKFFKPPFPLRDSKKLTKRQREAWVTYLKNQQGVFYSFLKISPRTIDRNGLSRVLKDGVAKVFLKLHKKLPRSSLIEKVFLDGGLSLTLVSKRDSSVETVIRGDEKIPAISCASILAKVHRDALMQGLSKRYSEFAFDENKGYGTRAHIRALRKYGPSPVHRLTFIKKFHRISGK